MSDLAIVLCSVYATSVVGFILASLPDMHIQREKIRRMNIACGDNLSETQLQVALYTGLIVVAFTPIINTIRLFHLVFIKKEGDL